ncbi:MAG: type IV toxin-antitoxin system AbiEi family antitoxin domain-containing protein [Candidatus Hadarchaeaceae archaeon]
MRLYELANMLKKSRMAVFSIKDICRYGGLKRDEAYVYLHRMLKKNMIHRIQKGKFSIHADPFVISTQLVTPSYVSFLSALYLHGKFEQAINTIFIVTPIKRPPIGVFGMDVKFVKLKPNLIFGFRKVRKGESYISLAELEKTVADILYLPKYGRINSVAGLMPEVDVQKLKKYAERMGEAVIRRAGYLLDRAGVGHDLEPRTKTVYKLNPSIEKLGNLNRKWLLYINEELG